MKHFVKFRKWKLSIVARIAVVYNGVHFGPRERKRFHDFYSFPLDWNHRFLQMQQQMEMQQDRSKITIRTSKMVPIM